MDVQRQLRVRLLGGFAAEVDGVGPVGPWERPSARRLACLLVLSPGRRRGREELAELLFGSLPPDRAANAVSKALSMARAVLEPDESGTILAADRYAVWIRPDVAVTADLYEHVRALESSLAMPGGPDREAALAEALAVEGVLCDQDRYADWVLDESRRLEALRHQARVELARERATRAAPVWEVADTWLRVLAHEPTCEEAYAGLLRAYLSAGARDQAIRSFHRCRAVLRAELGVDPGPEVAELHTAAMRLTREHTPVAPTRTRPVLIGRHREAEEVLRLLQPVTDAVPVTILVEGPAGIGKTCLLRTIRERLADRGWTCLLGTSVSDDRRIPHASLRSALDVPTIAAVAAREAGPLVRRLLSRTAEVATDAGAPPGSEGIVQLAGEIDALLDAVAARAPVLLVLDDIHWADEALQQLVHRLAARSRPGRWGLLVTARSDEPGAPVPGLLGSTHRLPLAPLSDRAVRSLVRRTRQRGRRWPRGWADDVVERSAGNPFFAVELTREADAGEDPGDTGTVPRRVVDLLERRIGRVSVAGRQLLPLVALAGGPTPYEVLLAAADDGRLIGSADDAIAALDELVAQELLDEAPQGVRLAHPLLRDAALVTTNRMRRARLHQLLAEVLTTCGGDEEAVARHRIAAFEAAQLLEFASDAAAAAFRAGFQARRLLAVAAAVELFQAGLSAFEMLTSDARLALRSEAVTALTTIAEVHREADRQQQAEEACRSAMALADSDDERARAWSALGAIPYRHGDLERAAGIYEHGLADVAEASEAARARLQLDAGWVRVRLGREEEAIPLLEDAAVVLAREGEQVEAARCLDRLGIALGGVGRTREGLEAAERALALAERIGDRSEAATITLHLAALLRLDGRMEEALTRAEEAATLIERTGDRYARSVTHWVTAQIHDALGDARAALRERDAEVALLIGIDNARNLAACHTHRAMLLRWLDRAEEAMTAAAAARTAAQQTGDDEVIALVDAELDRP